MPGSKADDAMEDGGDDESDAMSVDEPAELGGMRGFLPVSFGKVQKAPQVNLKALEASRRKDAFGSRQGSGGSGAAPDKKGVVQFGTRVKDAAAVLGASRRAVRAEENVKKAAAAAAARQAEEAAAADGLNRTSSRDEEDAFGVDAPPLPGKELEVLPVSHESVINAHEKAVTAIGLDPKGARMIAGSMDGWLRFYDFQGMSEAKESFRSAEPVEGHMVQAISWSTTGSCALVVCSDAHARIYDRDGSSRPIQSTVMGDMYVRDMTHTQGHTQMLTDGVWHPFAAENWITSSLDGTIRIWDLNAKPVGMDQVLPSMHVLKILDKRNVCIGGASGKSGGLYPVCCTYSPTDASGKIVGGCSDGSVQVFFAKARYQKPDRILRTAHTGPVTSVAFVAEGGASNLLVTRSMDDSMKIWDCRMLSDAKGPVKIFGDLPTTHEKTGVCTSPDGKYIVTGTAFQKASMGASTVRIFGVKDFKQVKSLDFGNRSVVRVTWHEDLNQLLVGTQAGEVVMLYNPYSSKKGALHFVGRHKRVKAAHELEDNTMGPIFNMTDGKDIQKFWNTGHGNMQSIRRQETRQNQKTITPAKPPNYDGDSVHTAGTKLVASIIKKTEGKSKVADQDSQKVLLAYADKAENDTQFMAAYKNQPKLLDYTVEASQGDQKMQGSLGGDFCRKCGQKICRCVDYSVVKRPKLS